MGVERFVLALAFDDCFVEDEFLLLIVLESWTAWESCVGCELTLSGSHMTESAGAILQRSVHSHGKSYRQPQVVS